MDRIHKKFVTIDRNIGNMPKCKKIMNNPPRGFTKKRIYAIMGLGDP